MSSTAFALVVLASAGCEIKLHGGRERDKPTTATAPVEQGSHDPSDTHDGPDAHEVVSDDAPSTRASARPPAVAAAPRGLAPAAPAGCGVITPAPASDGCGTCLVQKCCAQGRACEPDGTCKSCVARGAASLSDATCRSNSLYQSVHACVNGPCSSACNGGGGGGGGGGGSRSASCNQTRCSDGPGGDAMCRSRGCGKCSFGACLMF